MGEEDSREILKYFKKGKEFFRNIRTHINKNLKIAITQPTNLIIRKNYFPDDRIIRELYNETFACYYSNLMNASLTVALELLEYMTRKIYSKEFKTSFPKKHWASLLSELIEEHSKKKENKKVWILGQIDKYRDFVRNAQLHGNIAQLVDRNAKFYHNAINVFTGEKVVYPLTFKEEIHKVDDFFKAKDEIQNKGTNHCIFLINIFIVEFFIRSK